MFIKGLNTSRGRGSRLTPNPFPCLEINSQLMRSKAIQIETGTARTIDIKTGISYPYPVKENATGGDCESRILIKFIEKD